MYDLEGSDTGREWIEVLNDGPSAIDISGFKLFEGGVNHTLSIVSGSAVLSPGSYAVIADDPEKFKADWPSFSGILFDSAFSLSNSGETLTLKDASVSEEDTVSYSSSSGAAGDGLSLVRSGSEFSAATPSPGSGASSPLPPSQTPGSTPASAVVQQQTSAQVAGEPTTLAVRAGGDRVVAVGGGSQFFAEVLNAKGAKLSGARILWSFGNGESREGERVWYAYPYPGVYVVMVSASTVDGSATGRFAVEAIPPEVSMVNETDGGVSVFNHGAEELDVSLWIVAKGERTFRFPSGTFILPRSGIRLSPALLNLGAGEALLLYPNGARAAFEEERTAEHMLGRGDMTRVPLPRTLSPESIREREEQEAADMPQEVRVLGTTTLPEPSRDGEPPLPHSPRETLLPWLMALFLVIGLGGAAAVLLRRSYGPSDGYTIVDISEEKE